jgi:hypothetical protein
MNKHPDISAPHLFILFSSFLTHACCNYTLNKKHQSWLDLNLTCPQRMQMRMDGYLRVIRRTVLLSLEVQVDQFLHLTKRTTET